ncbi:unnamed protein product [Spirodela intermedia]|uniref:RING-type E3 ubiquitin transferase n=1 Tax=Spirodela intermedia TaxID=51605 RepID=A0A7I8IYH6_SPIIN|nr:unnamed protein product [Spirodela intermedia]CAA6662937.1 unnamed protein product [Spirodela intermedia]
MGSLCCCLQADHSEDFSLANSSIYGNCVCLRFLIGQLLHAYTSLFQQEHPTITPARPVSSDPPGGTGDNSMADTFRAPPRPLPYDDPRCSPLKASSHCHEESEPLRRTLSGPDAEPAWAADKLDGPDGGGGQSKPCPSELLLKQWPSEVAYVFPSFEDEDVCPTCLEEYTPEDPRIIMQCSHHFHLGCIYEWMERSEACPVCGKVMVFSERT